MWNPMNENPLIKVINNSNTDYTIYVINQRTKAKYETQFNSNGYGLKLLELNDAQSLEQLFNCGLVQTLFHGLICDTIIKNKNENEISLQIIIKNKIDNKLIKQHTDTLFFNLIKTIETDDVKMKNTINIIRDDLHMPIITVDMYSLEFTTIQATQNMDKIPDAYLSFYNDGKMQSIDMKSIDKKIKFTFTVHGEDKHAEIFSKYSVTTQKSRPGFLATYTCDGLFSYNDLCDILKKLSVWHTNILDNFVINYIFNNYNVVSVKQYINYNNNNIIFIINKNQILNPSRIIKYMPNGLSSVFCEIKSNFKILDINNNNVIIEMI